MLTGEQFQDWVEYYKQRPFGHWVDTTMRAQLVAAWGGKIEDVLPRIVEQVDFNKLEDEEKLMLLPGGCGVESYLAELKNTKE